MFYRVSSTKAEHTEIRTHLYVWFDDTIYSFIMFFAQLRESRPNVIKERSEGAIDNLLWRRGRPDQCER